MKRRCNMDTFSESISNSLSKGSVLEKEEVLVSGEAISNESICQGNILMDTYQVVSDAIQGGMGSVWRVHHKGQDSELAMKRPKPRFFAEGSAKRKERFIKECESWVGLGLHPNIVACYYVREIGGIPTVFSEWMEGGSLEDRIKDGSLYEGPEEEAGKRLLKIAIQAERGLDYAHDRGLIHQDVKPDNILLTEDYEAKVADFGLSGAKSALSVSVENEEEDSGSGEMTVLAGSGGYTPAYCSPEQIGGRMLGRKTDIYSWAASVMEMYLGKRLWKSGTEAGKNCAQYLDAPRTALPKKLKELLVKCMSAEEERRPYTFAEVDAVLLEVYREICGSEYSGENKEAAVSSAGSLNNQAVSYMELGMVDSAKSCWDRAQQIDPSHPESFYNKALLDWREGIRTGKVVSQMLQCHSYFKMTDKGKQDVAALAREAGKVNMEDPLFDIEPVYEAAAGHEVAKGWDPCNAVLWHGTLFVIALCDTDPVLFAYDAQSGQKLREENLSPFLKEEQKIQNVSLSRDVRFAFFTTEDYSLLSFDLETKKVRFKMQAEEPGWSNHFSGLHPIGTEGRFVFRTHHFGMGRSGPTVEVFDLKTGECLESKDFSRKIYSDRQLIRAGADGEVGEPEFEKYKNSLSDRYRVIPVIIKDDSFVCCDMDGEPIGSVVKLSGSVLQITPEGLIWKNGREGLMNMDPLSGKCLRSFPSFPNNPKEHNDVLIDDDGLGIAVFRWEGETGKYTWRFRRLAPIDEKDRADWAMAELEDYADYKRNMARLREIAEEFAAADTEEDMCRIYNDAVTVNRFFGSSVHRIMTETMHQRCRQQDGYFFESSDLEFSLSDQKSREILSGFGLVRDFRSEKLKNRMKTRDWIRSSRYSRDGKKAILYGADRHQRVINARTHKEIQVYHHPAPCGEGLYLVDIASEKLFFLMNVTADENLDEAGFCKDKRHIICKNNVYQPGQKWPKNKYKVVDLETMAVTKQSLLARQAAHGLTVEDAPQEKASLLFWEYGFFRFCDPEGCKAFMDQPKADFFILDAEESCGLIAYKEVIHEENFKTHSFLKVWSTDEERSILAVPDFEYKTACFCVSDENQVRLLVVPEKRKDIFSGTIYEYSCSYSTLPKRRTDVQIPAEWPEYSFKECDWEVGPGKGYPQEMLDQEAQKLSSDKKNIDDLCKAYVIYEELNERFPGYGKKLSESKETLSEAFGQIGWTIGGGSEAMRKYYEIFRDLAAEKPDNNDRAQLRDLAQFRLSELLSNSHEIEPNRQAVLLLDDLIKRFPDEEKYRQKKELALKTIRSREIFLAEKAKEEKKKEKAEKKKEDPQAPAGKAEKKKGKNWWKFWK